jgi:hypothetical protein
MWKLTCPVTFVLGGTVQTDTGAGSAQMKLTGPEKPLVIVIVTAASMADPC